MKRKRSSNRDTLNFHKKRKLDVMSNSLSVREAEELAMQLLQGK